LTIADWGLPIGEEAVPATVAGTADCACATYEQVSDTIRTDFTLKRGPLADELLAALEGEDALELPLSSEPVISTRLPTYLDRSMSDFADSVQRPELAIAPLAAVGSVGFGAAAVDSLNVNVRPSVPAATHPVIVLVSAEAGAVADGVCELGGVCGDCAAAGATSAAAAIKAKTCDFISNLLAWRRDAPPYVRVINLECARLRCRHAMQSMISRHVPSANPRMIGLERGWVADAGMSNLQPCVNPILVHHNTRPIGNRAAAEGMSHLVCADIR
jgi:hypothetical protein